jgi:hypothetical protein
VGQQPPKNYADFISVLSGGQNSGVNPLLLDKTQYGFGLNVSLRGGYAHTRPPIVKIDLDYGGDDSIQETVEGGYYQGGGFYRPDFGTESLIAQISGRLLKFTQGNSGWDVTDIGVTGDPNDPTIPQIWMWQTERWMVVNDGSGDLPIFYDGVYSRRSYGPSVELGVTALDFIPPIIGGTVDITLTAPYTGPFNVPVLLNGAYYQPISFTVSGANFNGVFTNLYGTVGATVPSGSQIRALPSVAGIMVVAQSYSFSATNMNVGSRVITLDLSTPFTGPVGQKLSITGMGGFANGKTLSWQVTAVAGNTVTIKNLTAAGVNYNVTTGANPVFGYNYPIGTIVNFSGNNQPVSIVAVTGSDFVVPAIGSTVEILTESAYTGPATAVLYVVPADGSALVQGMITYQPPAPPSAQITVLNLTDTTNNPEPQYPTTAHAPLQLLSVPELPAGRMGAYGMARNWMCLTDGISYIAGDIVGGASGTVAYNYRDSVLKTTENDFLSGGGSFRLPGSGDQITAMVFPPNLDASLGQGPLQISTAYNIFSNNSPVDRTTWTNLTNPLQSISLEGQGALAQNSTVLINSDTFFRNFYGFGSLVLARRDFGGWGNKTISNEMQRPLLQDNQSLLQFGSSESFDNRFIATCGPNLISAGVFHVGMVSLNFDLLSSIRTNAPPAWEGAWTGINTLQLISGRVNGVGRNFSFTFNLNTNKIELWELLSESAANQAQIWEDDNDTPILWLFETSAMFNKDIKPLTDLVELTSGELYLSNITSTVNVKVYYKPDFFPCWTLWKEFDVCADDDNTTGDGNKQAGYRMRLGLGQPDPTSTEETNNRPLRQGFFFQFRIEFTGYCEFRGLMVYAKEFPQQTPAPVEDGTEACQLIDCEVPNDLQIYSLQGYLPVAPPDNAPPAFPFRNQIVYYPNVCTTGTLGFTGTLPSWITMDVTNNQFIGKAGVFGEYTQAAANAEAQSNLNNFVSTQLALGNITCTLPAPTPDLLWYRYTEQTGFSTHDYSAAGNNGSNVCGWAAGPGSADAATNVTSCGYMTDASSPSTWAAGDFSYSLWVNPTGTPGSQYPLVMAQSGSNGYMMLAINSSNQLEFLAHYGTPSVAGGTITPGSWQMVTFTYNHTSGKMVLYINGVQVGTTTLISSFTNGVIYIGGSGPFIGSGFMPGSIADTRIYSSELSPTDVANIYAAGAQ